MDSVGKLKKELDDTRMVTPMPSIRCRSTQFAHIVEGCSLLTGEAPGLVKLIEILGYCQYDDRIPGSFGYRRRRISLARCLFARRISLVLLTTGK